MLDNSARSWRVLSTNTGMACQLSYDAVQSQAWRLHRPISARIGPVITNHVLEFCDCFD